MPLNDLIKEYSLQTLSDKTNISINSLEKLQEREWEKLQKTQVVGFLKILEREYNINLDELRAEAENFYKEHTTKESKNPIDVVGVANVKSESKFVSGFITLVTLAVLAYATWYYFAGHKVDTFEKSQESNGSGMFEDTLNSVKNLLGMGAKSSAQSVTAAVVETSVEANSSTVAKTDDNSSKPAKSENSLISTEASNPTNSVPAAASKNQSSESTKFNTLSTQDAAVATESASSGSSQNSTLEVNSSTQTSSTDSSKESRVEQNNSNTVSTPAESSTETSAQTATEGVAQADRVENSSSETTTSNNNETNSSEFVEDPVESNKTTVTLEKITIKPLSKRLWLGIYNLQSQKRVNKFITSTIDLPVNAKLAIITGHNRLEITADGSDAMRFAQKGRVYLLVSQEGIKEISKSEYKQVTKNRAW